MSTKTTIKRISAVAALALAFGGLSTVAANATAVTTVTSVSQTLGTITHTAGNTWTQAVTFTVAGTGFVDGTTIGITEAHTGTSTATNVVATAGVYTLLAGDHSSATAATFSSYIVYTAAADTDAGHLAAAGTQILTPTLTSLGDPKVGSASAAITLVNPNFTVTVANGGSQSTATQVAGPANSVTIKNNNTLSSVYYTITGGATTAGAIAGTVTTAVPTFSVATPSVGTITVNGYAINPATGTASSTATDTITITVVAALAQTAYVASTLYGNSGATTPAAKIVADAALTPAVVSTLAGIDTAFSASLPATTGTVAANWILTQTDATGLALTQGWKAMAVSASIGTLALSAPITGVAASGGYLSGTPSVDTPISFTLSSNGLSGISTVTVSVNGVTVKTYTVTFTGAASKIVLTAINPVVAKGTVSGVTANTNAFEVQEFDAAGNVLAVNTAITLTPADKTIATAASPVISGTLGGSGTTVLSSTIGGSTVTGVAAGTTTFTATDGTLVSNPVTVRVSSATPTSVVFTTDAASYPAGGVGSLKTTISDAAGTVPAGTYAVLTAAATSTYALTVGTLPGGSIIVDDTGTATTAFNAPIADSSAVTITGTAAATTITVTPAVFSVTSGGSTAANAAADAAAEATDAANAATDAANAAADSADQATAAAQDAGDKADAALAAVTALSQQVTDLLAKIADLSTANEALAAALASQQRTVAAQSKALAAQTALVARLVRKAKA